MIIISVFITFDYVYICLGQCKFIVFMYTQENYSIYTYIFIDTLVEVNIFSISYGSLAGKGDSSV